METKHNHTQTKHTMKITTLLLMGAFHFVLMYILMYAMVDVFGNVYSSLNQVYMAGLMTTPMLILEILLMRSMYENKKVLNVILVGSIVVFLLCAAFIRQQTAITNKEFLKSMIPHHAGALLMCKKAPIQDPEIKELCKGIISSQQAEIDFMREKLRELD